MDDPLTLVLTEVRARRDADIKHFESLDTKAGILLGFSGALAAFPVSGEPSLIAVGRIAAVAATIGALTALLPRRFPVLFGASLRTRHAHSSREEAIAALIDYLIQAEGPAARVLRLKARLLVLAAPTLVVGVGLTSAGLILG